MVTVRNVQLAFVATSRVSDTCHVIYEQASSVIQTVPGSSAKNGIAYPHVIRDEHFAHVS